jgi:membrane protease YdiL (CAAX protease family)
VPDLNILLEGLFIFIYGLIFGLVYIERGIFPAILTHVSSNIYLFFIYFTRLKGG